ncbi:calcium-translocating P-type ATPase, PMCA-type [Candidatus Arthromitus sp. SFB-rat-Yit]|uniref:calcium-translocating P-type ATPase, PMCA-type n=1 Tax=Candidatus Arthromitus sp. SFB-rat-Yit TaxID=1041504 RepID=UPI000227A36B|nr:calcium-translocating P-type ATPase, PMCA-type [Candidatus Arthromitus sp. SFB-rat-Yit]BAK80864.1 calcium-translocating P-type ATPase, PMCA-type [Candidatus Arthromitus sp. SFB-rat-Yit]
MWHSKSIEYISKTLKTNTKTGLSTSYASKLLQKNGTNELNKEIKKSLLKLIFDQINNILIYILILSNIISFFLGSHKEAIIIFLVIILNSSIGIIQEYKSEKSLESLKKLSSPKSIVKRDNKIIEINSENLVVGDIVLLDAGRIVPADIRLFECANLKIDESALTGESVPSEKSIDTLLKDESIPLADRKNMGYMSTIVTYGRGEGIVVSTGMNTEIGKIASFLNDSKNEITPLQKKLNILGKNIGILTIIICVIIMITGLIQGNKLIDIFFIAVSLAVAAIPEGLSTIVTIVLAIGVQKMIKKNAIVRKLSSVETLGSVNVICSDKTGTLTINKMTVIEYFINNSKFDAREFKNDDNTKKFFIRSMTLCNDSSYSKDEEIGDPTEIALLRFAYKNIENHNFKRISEIPFDSDRKLMTTVNNVHDIFYSFTKGAVDNLLKICNKISINDNIHELTDDIRKNILNETKRMGDSALRTLGFAYKEIINLTKDNYEDNLIFLGIVGMIDPPREEVKQSIEISKKSGIKTIMITGDHRNTAFAIAKNLSIAENIDETMLGSEINKLTDNELNDKIKNISVFARVSPEHKVKIVRSLKSLGNIVAMTGDGVNDAPSLKMADVGISMGITGTDVCKNASDIILTDDNFKTIITSIEEGRNIFNNIKKSVIFLLTCNLGEILTIFVSILFNFELPLSPTHLLWINLITDSLPALSLGVDTHDKNIMNNKPKKSNENLISKSNILKLIFNALIIGIVSIISFLIGYKKIGLVYAQSMTFIVLSFSQLFLSLSMRSEDKYLLEIGLFSNMKLIFSILIGLIIQIIIITTPSLNIFFGTQTLSTKDWITSIALSIIPFIVNEFLKPFSKNK